MVVVVIATYGVMLVGDDGDGRGRKERNCGDDGNRVSRM